MVKNVESDDIFSFNNSFSSKAYKIKIAVPASSTGEATDDGEDEAATTEDVMKQISYDRQHQIDAAIIRIMKSRKSLCHTALLSELMNMLKFTMNVR